MPGARREIRLSMYPGLPFWMSRLRKSWTGRLRDSLDAEEVAKMVNQLVSDPAGDRRQISAAAGQAAATADTLARDLAAMNPDPAVSAALINAICADSERIAAQGERSAEQAGMVLNSLFIGYEQGKKPVNDTKIRAAIGDLYKQFERVVIQSGGIRAWPARSGHSDWWVVMRRVLLTWGALMFPVLLFGQTPVLTADAVQSVVSAAASSVNSGFKRWRIFGHGSAGERSRGLSQECSARDSSGKL